MHISILALFAGISVCTASVAQKPIVIPDYDSWIKEYLVPGYSPDDHNLILSFTTYTNGLAPVSNATNQEEHQLVTCKEVVTFCSGFVATSVDACKFFGGWTAAKGAQLLNTVLAALDANAKQLLKDLVKGVVMGIIVNFLNYYINLQLDKGQVADEALQSCATQHDLDAVEAAVIRQIQNLNDDIIFMKRLIGNSYCSGSENVAQSHEEGNDAGDGAVYGAINVNAQAFKTPEHTPPACP